MKHRLNTVVERKGFRESYELPQIGFGFVVEPASGIESVRVQLRGTEDVAWGAHASRVLPSQSRRRLPDNTTLVTRWFRALGSANVFGETPNTARGTRALPNTTRRFRPNPSAVNDFGELS